MKLKDRRESEECSRTFGDYAFFNKKVVYMKVVRHAGEGGRGSRCPSCLSVRGAGGAKVPFLNAITCFLIVNMIQRRSYKLKASNI